MPDPTTAQRIGERIRTRRRALNLTQTQLAEAAGTTQDHLSAVESGRHAIGTDLLGRLAAALDTTIGDLVT